MTHALFCHKYFFERFGKKMKNNTIAKKLKEFRNLSQLSVREVTHLLADRSINVSEKTIYGWESGQNQPSGDTLLILCEIYNIEDVLGAFGYSDKETFPITKYEEKLIMHYREHPEFHETIKKLLEL